MLMVFIMRMIIWKYDFAMASFLARSFKPARSSLDMVVMPLTPIASAYV
jgi:hypothetical protein